MRLQSWSSAIVAGVGFPNLQWDRAQGSSVHGPQILPLGTRRRPKRLSTRSDSALSKWTCHYSTTQDEAYVRNPDFALWCGDDASGDGVVRDEAVVDDSTREAPLLNALRECAEMDAAAFHFPGHRRGGGAPPMMAALVGKGAFAADLPELPELDNLHAAEGVIYEAQNKAARLFSETPFSFVARPILRHHQRHSRSLVVRAGFTSYRSQSLTCHSARHRFSCLPNDSRQPGVIDIGALAHDEEWQKARREESKQLQKQRQLEAEAEEEKEAEYRNIGNQLKDFPEEKVKEARKFVASLIKSGAEVEEMIEKAGESGELTPLVLFVIRNRLELARYDNERDAIQALDMLYRRVEMEMLQREASVAMQLLNQLLNLHDGFSHEEWLRRCRSTMLQIFPPEDAFTILGGSGFELENQMGPIEIPEEDDALLRIDFIREVDELLLELEAETQIKPISGFDAESVAVRLRQQEKLRAIQQVKDLRNLAATLKW